MIRFRPAAERGHAQHGWLDSRHSFSFAEYQHPEHMGWGNLRVLNDDRILPGSGFGTHGHRDMEIVSWVLEGALAHRDSLGSEALLRPGHIQRMSAGTGVRHSEYNGAEATTHFLQIWFLPDAAGTSPGYEEKAVPDAALDGRLAQVAAREPREPHAVRMGADAGLWIGRFGPGQSAEHRWAPGRLGYVFCARGSVRVAGHRLGEGDALLLRDEPAVTIDEGVGAELLVFDLAP